MTARAANSSGSKPETAKTTEPIRSPAKPKNIASRVRHASTSRPAIANPANIASGNVAASIVNVMLLADVTWPSVGRTGPMIPYAAESATPSTSSTG